MVFQTIHTFLEMMFQNKLQKSYVTKSSPLFFSFGNNVTAAAKRRLNLSPGVFQWQQMGSLYRGHFFASHNTGFL